LSSENCCPGRKGEPARAGPGSRQAAQETSLSDSSRSSDQALLYTKECLEYYPYI